MTIKFHTGAGGGVGGGGGVELTLKLRRFFKGLCHATCYLFKKLKRVFTSIEF